MRAGLACGVSVRAWRITLTVLVLAVSWTITPANADYNQSQRWFQSKDYRDRVFIQLSLILTGHYNGLADGVFGKNTYGALVGFQQKIRRRSTGYLSPSEESTLRAEAARVYGILGFERHVDHATGLTLSIPQKIVGGGLPTKRGTRWGSSDGGVEIQTILMPNEEKSFQQLYSDFIAESRTRRIFYSTIHRDFFVVTGVNQGTPFYMRFEAGALSTRGFSVAWDPSVDTLGERVSIFLSSMMSAGADPMARYASRTDPPPNRSPRSEETPSSRGKPGSGSGFVVSADGLVVTNNHVVDGCGELSIKQFPGSRVRLVAADEEMDLAMLQVSGVTRHRFLQVSSAPVQLGEEIVAFGFPMTVIMGEELQVQAGIVTSKTGLAGDKSNFTVSAAIQPGNSGGPLLDKRGYVVGVAVAKINERVAMEITGNALSNYNFAIHGEQLRTFLAPFRGIETGEEGEEKSVEALAATAQDTVVMVVCR